MKVKLALFGAMFISLMNLFFVMPRTVNAQCQTLEERSILDFPTWDQYLERADDDGCRIANFEFPQDLVLVILALVDMLIRLGAFVAVGFIIYGGFRFMISQGQPDKIAQAKTVITEAIIGLVISIIAVAVVSYVAGLF